MDRGPARAGLLLRALLVALLLLAPAMLFAAEVTYLVRPVEVKRRGTASYARLNLGDQVYSGDTIRTGAGGRVEVTLGAGRVFRIGQSSEVALPELEGSDERGMQLRFNMLLGRFWAGIVRPLSAGRAERLRVTTPTATIGVKGTQFGVDHDAASKASQVLVIEGTVAAQPPVERERMEIPGPREVAPPQEVTRDEWLLLVTRDQKLVIRPDGVPVVEPLTPEDKADEWVRFNTERDAQLARQ